ncbi:MAG: serine/threonine protein kinase [Planctomycetes bacterium]|nr:serine/threonine protein kinase [Planctomycetota bacterium]
MDDDREHCVDVTIADYLKAVDAGQFPDRDALLASQPEFADELRAFFADHDRTAKFAEPIRELAAAADPQATIGPRAEAAPAELSTIAPGDKMPSAGSRVGYFGDYELLSEIARGGMGVVFCARQVSLNRIVALKMILAGQLASAQEVQRFQAEARTAANLQHANIVAIHEVGEHDGQHYFSMDYVEGRNLTDMVRDSPLPPHEAARYVKLCAEAIHYAHQQGTLHRDLKPSNVLIDKFDQPRVTDFGLAKQLAGEPGASAPAFHTQTGAAVGTPSYMPPEQASADRGKLGPASDVYSLGAVLYELVTGRPPFRAATPMDTLLQVLSSEPAAPRLVNPSLSRDLETIVLKCLAKEPEKRYASAKDLADDLQAYLENRPISARRPGYLERAGRWLRHHRRSVALSAVAAGVAATLLIGGSTLLDWYREAQLGRVVLTTDGPNLVAEIIDANDKLVVPAFTVPTTKPVALRAGAYQLRLSAS